MINYTIHFFYLKVFSFKKLVIKQAVYFSKSNKCQHKLNLGYYLCTVKPVYIDHHGDDKKWSLEAGCESILRS